jgi:predicted ATP-grasp superfamily ATP-dependent carboligase
LIVCFKPSTRVEKAAEALGARPALAPARIARRLENKLLLPELAAAANVRIPHQTRVEMTPDSAWPTIVGSVGADVVVQSPRGFSGKRTFRVGSEERWIVLRTALQGRPVKVAEYVAGRPGTLHAVVDWAGRVVVSAPIVQVTGEPALTPYPLGSCGNDFTWRPAPHPGAAPAKIAEAMGPVLAERGYRGAFGLDFVVPGPDEAVLIELNPRLTASFALYASWCPRLLDDHLTALAGDDLEPARLQAIPGGQLLVHQLKGSGAPLEAEDGDPEVVPHPALEVTQGGVRGRLITRGAVVLGDGTLGMSVGPPPLAPLLP